MTIKAELVALGGGIASRGVCAWLGLFHRAGMGGMVWANWGELAILVGFYNGLEVYALLFAECCVLWRVW